MIPHPRSILLPLSVATGLSLLGDTTLYTVLPTHTAEAGISLAVVGILLSANRWIRLPLYGPIGFQLERLPRKPIFVLAMFLGTASTWLYSFNSDFWLFLVARLMWGIAWVGIWLGGTTIVFDVTTSQNRGRWLGIYHIAFFAGAGGGAAFGGILTDTFGYYATMEINTVLTLAGTLIALLFLKETRPGRRPELDLHVEADPDAPPPGRKLRAELASATALMFTNRLVQEGLLLATLALFVQSMLGDPVLINGVAIGSATLTGAGFGLTTLVAAVAAPVSGTISDRTSNRWQVAALSLLPGIAGFGLLQLGTPAGIVFGLIGASIASGSSANLSTALIGDLGNARQHGRRLGGLLTVGDLASAIGPILAFGLAPFIGLSGIYWLAAGVFALMAVLAFFWSRKVRLLAKIPAPLVP